MSIYLTLLVIDAIVALALYVAGEWSRATGITIAVVAICLFLMLLVTGAGGFR